MVLLIGFEIIVLCLYGLWVWVWVNLVRKFVIVLIFFDGFGVEGLCCFLERRYSIML